MRDYIYNGVKLPELPERDKDIYPYTTIVIERDFGVIYTRCYFTEYPMAQLKATSKDLCDSEGDGWTAPNTRVIRYNLIDGKWSNRLDTVWTIYAILCDKLIYTNYNLYVFQTDILVMSTSDPIPVYTPSPVSLYRKTNNQLNPITLYRKESGQNKKLTLYRGETQ